MTQYEKEQVLIMVEPEEVEMLVSLSNLALGNKMLGSASFRILEKRVDMTQLCEKHYSSILSQQEIVTKFDQMEKTDGNKSLFMPRICDFSCLSANQSLSSHPRRNDYWTDY